MTDYQPISCALYSQYEIAILHHTPLRVRWRDLDGVTYLETLTPEDLETREGEEFLVARNAQGQCRRLRLDRMITIPITGEGPVG
ncbi:MAG: transcriptional antiterminator, Rof [Gammaproteobacteria bacterium]|nr:transcriptional antiterminator, Rof [Gammaproteobacteria bacterium]MDE2345348.1 transcriptional antiterminator, Rof [Gammaproteobacteria bacterium]